MSGIEEGAAVAAGARFQVVADQSACCGYGACVALCPELFALERGLVVVINPRVAPQLEAKAAEAVQSCPQGALALVPLDR